MIFYISEATNKPDYLLNDKTSKVNPSLMTWQEYYKKINPTNEFHESSAYNIDLGDLDWVKTYINKKNIIKTIKVDKITLSFYKWVRKNQYAKRDGEKYLGVMSDEEMKEAGLNINTTSFICIDAQTGQPLGGGFDEHGAVLIQVVKEYRSLGIGEELVKLYRSQYPEKESGGFTNSGFAQIEKYYNWSVSQFLANGIYSDMIRKGDITKERVQEILKSRPHHRDGKKKEFSKEKKSPLSKYYGGNNERLFYITTNSIFIFDSALKDYDDLEKHNLKELVSEKLIYAYLHVLDFNDYPQIYNCYGNDKDLTMAVYLMTVITNGEGGLGNYYYRNFDDNVKKNLDRIYTNNNTFTVKVKKDKGYMSDVPLKLLFTKEQPSSLAYQLKKQTKDWFKENDRYEEIETYVQELAYSLTQD